MSGVCCTANATFQHRSSASEHSRSQLRVKGLTTFKVRGSLGTVPISSTQQVRSIDVVEDDATVVPSLTRSEQLLDELAARVDDLQRRFDGLIRTLRQEEVCQKLGVKDFEFMRTDPTDVPLGIRTMKHEGARAKLEARLREQQVLKRLARIPADQLEDLIRAAPSRSSRRART